MVDSVKPPIISAPSLLSAKRRRREAVATGIMWTVYSFLWTPLLTLMAWWAGSDLAYEAIVKTGGIPALLVELKWFALWAFLIFVSVTTWSYSNRVRFRGKESRQYAPAMSDAQMMRRFGVTRMQLDTARGQKIVSIDFDDDGVIQSLRPGSGYSGTTREMPAIMTGTGSWNRSDLVEPE